MKRKEKVKKKRNLITNPYYALAICFVFAVVIFGLFAVSVFDTDKTVSQRENRNLEARPAFSVNSFLSGEFSKHFDKYFSDTFPFRDFFLDINEKISGKFSRNTVGSTDEVVIIQPDIKDDFDGQSID